MHDEDVEFEREVIVVVDNDETIEVDDNDDDADPEVELHVMAAPISTLGHSEAEVLDELTPPKVAVLALDELIAVVTSDVVEDEEADGLVKKYAPMATMMIITTRMAAITAALAALLSFEAMLADFAGLFNPEQTLELRSALVNEYVGVPVRHR